MPGPTASQTTIPSSTLLAGKVALVTGGTSGIGRAAAVHFARAGAKVVITGRREAEGRQSVDQVRAAGGDARYFRADASSEADAKATVEFTVKEFGRLDAAFNNAGIEGDLGKAIHEQSFDNYRKVFDINVGGVLLSMKYQVPAMLKSGGGAIVNNSSAAGVVGMGGFGVYVASKHAVLGLTKSAALDYARQGVRVNAVSPAGVVTEMYERFVGPEGSAGDMRAAFANMHPVGRVGTVDEIAAAVVFLCSPLASFITGTNLLLDGGFTAQ